MEAQIEKAIEIAWDPRSDPTLKTQALDFVNQLRSESQAWSVCLPLATRQPPASEVVRHYALEIVNNAVREQKIDRQGMLWVKDKTLEYVRTIHAEGSSQQDPFTIENKFSQTVTYLFTVLYATEWQTFFDDLLALSATTSGTRFYLKTLGSIHDEIADIMVTRVRIEQQRDNELKDLVRDRDVQKLAQSWQQIMQYHRRSDRGVLEQCLIVVGKWSSWTDLSLIINDTLLSLLSDLVGSGLTNSGSTKLRDTALMTFTEILSKKMKPPEKLQLVEIMNVQTVVSQLASSRALQELRFTADYDTDLAEVVAKLVNNTVDDLVSVIEAIDDGDPLMIRAKAQLEAFMPHMLRFFSDEFDEICSSVIPCLTDMLTLFRRKASSGSQYASTLPPILQAIIRKMKYDETSDWGSEDAQTDEAEFAELRKRLHNLQQAVAAVDENLYINTISEIVVTTLSSYQDQGTQVDWRDMDLALYELYLFGQLAVKNSNLYVKSKPVSAAAERLIEIMAKLVESNVADYPHPAIKLQYMELCVRYASFFEANTNYIPRVLEQFIQLVHHDHVKVKFRSWYLFHRFVRQSRQHLGNIAQSVIQAIGDLLPINAEVTDETSDTDELSSTDDSHSADARFVSQLYLYEAVGNICSSKSVPVETQVYYLQSVMSPLFLDLEGQIELAKAGSGDARALLQVHHLIMALGTLAHGFSEWMPGRPSTASPPAAEVSVEFEKAAEAILLALEALNHNMEIRAAARSAFSRFIGVLGNRVLQQLPRWIHGLLSSTSSKDEMATFLRTLDQVVFGFKEEILDILNTLLTPFLRRVFAGIGEPTHGTDDEIQLTELKMQYLSFLLVILNNNLGRVFVTSENQGMFESVISTLEHFARDASDLSTAKFSFVVLTKMVTVWGGPDIVAGQAPSEAAPQPELPGFDKFMIERFSPLTWVLPSTQGFDARDAQGRQVVMEAALLKKTIYLKAGREYLDWLRDRELGTTGMDGGRMQQFLTSICELDAKHFQKYFLNMISSGNIE